VKSEEGHRGKTPLLRSFNHAFQGLVSAVRFERNMRVHMVLAFAVLLVSIFLNLSRLQLVVIFVAVSFVFITELINSAIEAVVDMVTDEFDPRAKAAKDMAAGAVLVASMNALVVAYLVLADRLTHVSLDLLTVIRRRPHGGGLGRGHPGRRRGQSEPQDRDALVWRPAFRPYRPGLRRLDRTHLRRRRPAASDTRELHRLYNGRPSGSDSGRNGHPFPGRDRSGCAAGYWHHHSHLSTLVLGAPWTKTDCRRNWAA
jgi:diacylglycerol kinase